MKITLGITGLIVTGVIAATVLLNGQVVSVDNARAFIETEIADLEHQLEYLEVARPATLAIQKSAAGIEKAEMDAILTETTMGAKAKELLERRIRELDRASTDLDQEVEEMPRRIAEIRTTIAELRALLVELR